MHKDLEVIWMDAFWPPSIHGGAVESAKEGIELY
jgi:hypothetical protein